MRPPYLLTLFYLHFSPLANDLTDEFYKDGNAVFEITIAIGLALVIILLILTLTTTSRMTDRGITDDGTAGS